MLVLDRWPVWPDIQDGITGFPCHNSNVFKWYNTLNSVLLLLWRFLDIRFSIIHNEIIHNEKNFFVLIALLFTVECFAAPPPDSPAVFPTEDVGFIQSQKVTFDYSFKVQPEVAFVCIGNSCNFFLSTDLNDSRLNYGYSNRLHGW